MIRVRDLVKTFGQTRAVDGISFDVEKGEILGFLGPNGAGKTTTLRVLACFHPATSGSASVAGHDVFKDPVAVRRAIGYLPENVPLYQDLRVEEYLSYRAALKGVARSERRSAVGRAMERCGVTEVRRKLVGNVSRGYRQRVGLADALVARPPVLILDEPTSGLDPNQRVRIKELVRELASEHTVLFSSHILSEVEDVSNRILVIHRGTMRADGTPRQLVEEHLGRTLVVEARMSAAELQVTMAGVPGVTEVVMDAPGGAEDAGAEVTLFHRATCAVIPGVDPRDDAWTALSTRNATLRELRLEQPTLETFFQQITADAVADDAVAATKSTEETS